MSLGIISLSIVAVATTVIAPTHGHAFTTNAWQNGNSGLCLDDPGGGASWGQQMQQWGCNHTAAQGWNYIQVGTDGTQALILLQNQASGLCLDVWQDQLTTAFQPVVQWGCNAYDPAQVFFFPDDWGYPPYCGTAYAISTQNGGYSNHYEVEVGWGSTQWGATVDIYPDDQTLAQNWCPTNA